MNHFALVADLFLQVFLQILKALLEIAEIDIAKIHSAEVEIAVVEVESKVMTPGHIAAPANFFLHQLHADFLLLTFAHNSERDGLALLKSLKQFSQLTRLEQDLVVQHFENVILLNPGRGGRSIGNDIVNDESESFGQTKLVRDHARNRGCFHAEKDDWNFRRVVMSIGRHRSVRRLRRLGWLRWLRWLRKSCNRQERDSCDGSDGFCVHGL